MEETHQLTFRQAHYPYDPFIPSNHSFLQSSLCWCLPWSSRYASGAPYSLIPSLMEFTSRRIQYLSRSQIWIYFRTPGIFLPLKYLPVVSHFVFQQLFGVGTPPGNLLY